MEDDGFVNSNTGKYVLAGLALASLSGMAFAAKTPLRVLMIGGGPSKDHNQVAIESNVRYVSRLLLPETPLRVLFTDGNPQSVNVQLEGEDKKLYYRAPQLPRQDGPAKSPVVRAELNAVAADAETHKNERVLLYFTGHGSPVPRSNYDNNHFDLWEGDAFSVKDLAASLQGFPKATPVAVVMVQCFSGSFGNLLFKDADPTQELIDQKVCGFFASIAQRPAAGCTPEINEAEYKDFTSYFFAALTGTDRMGRPVTGSDYNRDGKVGMNEAFCYSLLNDDSIDTPVCTSDTFLRRFVTTPEADVFKTPYSQAKSWANPAQKIALEGLAKLLDYSGEDSLGRAYDRFGTLNVQSMEIRDVRLIRFVRLAKSIVLAHELSKNGDKKIKARFADLLKLENGNPLKG